MAPKSSHMHPPHITYWLGINKTLGRSESEFIVSKTTRFLFGGDVHFKTNGPEIYYVQMWYACQNPTSKGSVPVLPHVE